MLKNTLVGQAVKEVYREGKELHFQFSKDDVLGLHLMLHGAMNFGDTGEVVKHPVIELLFEGNKKLVLTDWQRAAKIKLKPDEPDVPDALSKKVNFDFLKTALQKRTTIKTFLMDQKITRGIGNAYADEILIHNSKKKPVPQMLRSNTKWYHREKPTIQMSKSYE